MGPELFNFIHSAEISTFDPLSAPQVNLETGEPEVHSYGYFLGIEICGYENLPAEQQDAITQHFLDAFADAGIEMSLLDETPYKSIAFVDTWTFYEPGNESSLERWEGVSSKISEALDRPLDMNTYEEFFSNGASDCGTQVLSQAPVLTPSVS